MTLYGLFSVGMVLLLGLLGGKVAHRFRVPRITGYMLTGLLLGPSVLSVISSATLSEIHVLNEIALGLILFAIGGEFQLSRIRALGKRIIWIGLAESAGAFVLVFAATSLITGDFALSILLAAMSMATAPGVILLVTREYKSVGPATDTILTIVALNNVVCLVAFRFAYAIYSLVAGDPIGQTSLVLFKELVIAAMIGGGVGVMISYWEQAIDDLSELLLVIIGGLLLGIGLARSLGISPLLVCLIIGAVTANMSMMHRLVYAELRQTEMPFYIMFFVLSGASLHLDALPNIGFLGLAYLVARPMGKALGSYVSARKFGAPKSLQNNLGLALLPQAGVAIGMSMTVMETRPDIGPLISTVILSSVIVYESVGPYLTMVALKRIGELHPE